MNAYQSSAAEDASLFLHGGGLQVLVAVEDGSLLCQEAARLLLHGGGLLLLVLHPDAQLLLGLRERRRRLDEVDLLLELHLLGPLLGDLGLGHPLLVDPLLPLGADHIDLANRLEVGLGLRLE